MMKILLLSPLVPCSGNATTIGRIRGHFERHGYKCKLTSPEYFTDQKEFLDYIHHQGYSLILAIHAYKSGILLAGCKLPYILVLGGTDVHQYSEDPEKMAVMTEAIANAKHIVCFGSSLRDKFSEKWPHHVTDNLSIVPQAVDTNPSSFNVKRFIENNFQLTNGPQITVPDIKQLKMTQAVGYIHVNNNHKQEVNTLNISEDNRISSHEDNNQIDLSLKSQTDTPLLLHTSHENPHKTHDRDMESHDRLYCDMIYNDGHITESSILTNSVDIKYTHNQDNHISIPTPNSINIQDISKLDTNDTVGDVLFFTLVGGIRPVKDPLYLVEEFSEWARTKSVDCFLLIVGPKMNDDYFRYFAGKISSHSHVIYIPGLSLADTHAVIKDSFAVVNTSLSEGMAISILEAMHLRTPVIVRDIPGNRNIVRHGDTGLIFNTVQEFFSEADKLIDDRKEVTKLTSNAYRYILQHHCIQTEEGDYMRIAQQYL